MKGVRRKRRAKSWAGAVDATMFGAGAAGLDELFFEGLTGAVGTDGGVCGGDSRLFSEGVDGVFGKIDVANDLAVGGFERREYVVDALTDDLVSCRVRLSFGDEVFGPLLEGAVFGGAMAVMIDNGVAQDAIEPCHRGLVFVERGGFFDSADVRSLNNVFGDGVRADTVFDEVEKLLSLFDEASDGFGLHE